MADPYLINKDLARRGSGGRLLGASPGRSRFLRPPRRKGRRRRLNLASGCGRRGEGEAVAREKTKKYMGMIKQKKSWGGTSGRDRPADPEDFICFLLFHDPFLSKNFHLFFIFS